MAAISATRTHTTTTTTSTTTSTLTPPSSSQEDRPWGEYPNPQHTEVLVQDKKQPLVVNDTANGGHALTSHHAPSDDHTTHMTNGDSHPRKPTANGSVHAAKSNHRPQDLTNRTSPPYGSGSEPVKMNGTAHHDHHTEHTTSRRNVSSSAADKRIPVEGDGSDEDSKWIHRDKLALIESQELQAAGIILPRQRMPSRVRRDHRPHEPVLGPGRASDASLTDRPVVTRSRTNSSADHHPKPADIEIPSWDLRLPEEIVAEANKGFATPTGLSKGGTRIPVAKVSPAPLSLDYLERESPSARKPTTDGPVKDGGDSISYPKPRSRSASASASVKPAADTTPPSTAQGKRSATDGSPKKASNPGGATRRPSARGPSASGRPKTRSSSNKDSTSSAGTRPSTRSGDLSAASSKQPEGDPPWLVSAYQPDPRLPPDQQLLPTVARRLQQEKWEKEGKFGNVYDKEFRPLTEDGFLQPPEKREPEPKLEVPEPEPEPQRSPEWPLRGEAGRSQTPKLISSYSTMPKIIDVPPQLSPLPSPRTPGMPPQHQPLSPNGITQAPEQQKHQQEKEKESKEGCGCCIVM